MASFTEHKLCCFVVSMSSLLVAVSTPTAHVRYEALLRKGTNHPHMGDTSGMLFAVLVFHRCDDVRFCHVARAWVAMHCWQAGAHGTTWCMPMAVSCGFDPGLTVRTGLNGTLLCDSTEHDAAEWLCCV